MKTKVVNVKKEQCDIYIGRPSIWGNPFEIGRDGTRKEVIKKHMKYPKKNKDLLSRMEILRGKKLGCFCKPKACHGDNYVKLLERETDD